jgi:hypothetical protein
MPKVLFTVPPFWIVKAPVLATPTLRPVACAPAAPTTVALGVTVSILVLSVLVGTPVDQLLALNQSPELAPIHNWLAFDGTVVANTAPSGTTDAAQQYRCRQTEKLAMRPRYSSFAAAPTQYDSL